jgi:hypothetical protein
LEDLVRNRTGINLRKIVLPRGPSDIARIHRVRSIPHLLLYDRGNLVATGTQQVLNRIR